MKNEEKKYGPGLLVQLFMLVSVSVLASGFITYFSQNRVAQYDKQEEIRTFVEEVSDETIAAVKEYPAYKWLLRYWYEHADALEIEYDVAYERGTQTEKKASAFIRRNPGIVLRYAGEEEIANLPEEDQKLYAEIMYSWLITRINQIKLAYKVDFLYCIVVDTDTAAQPYAEQFFLFSAADPGAVRGTEYLQVYPLGMIDPTREDTERAAMREAVESARVRNIRRRTSPDIDVSGQYMDEYTFLSWIGGRAALIGMSFNLKKVLADERMRTREGTLYAMFYQFLLMQLIMLHVYFFVVKPLRKVRQNMRMYGEKKDSRLVRENLTKALNGPGSLAIRHNEFGELSEGLVQLTEQVDAYVEKIRDITAEKERIAVELSLAADIQTQMLPPAHPAFHERTDIDLFAIMDPAREVGGDFYDYFLVDHDHLVLVMADVSSKGVPAALFMAITKALLKNRALAGESPAQILTSVNEQLCEGNEAGFFVTAWVAVIELSTGRGMAANAGHEHPAICRRGGSFELIKYKHDPAIAMLDGIRFHEHAFEIFPGDRLFVYTDGIPEAADSDRNMFGTDRMLETLNRDPDLPLEDLLNNLHREIEAFEEGTDQFDDITMMCLAYREETEEGS